MPAQTTLATIPTASQNGVVIMTFHPRLPNSSLRIYREGPAPIGGGPRRLRLASPLAEVENGTFRIPRTNHVRTMELPENLPPPGWNGRTPYFNTSFSENPDPLLAETNRRPRTGPRLRFQYTVE